MSPFKLAKFFYRQRIKGFPTPTAPHFDEETLAFFTEKLKAARSYVEFGAGGSTIMADRLGIPTVSVEGDRYYAKSVRKGLRGGSVRILTPDIGLTERWGKPLFRKPTPRRLAKWRRYIEAPFGLAPDPDLILVDGRFRVACALECARRVKQATLIVDDYYDGRPQYAVLERWLGKPHRIGRSAVFDLHGQLVPEEAVTVHDPS